MSVDETGQSLEPTPAQIHVGSSRSRCRVLCVQPDEPATNDLVAKLGQLADLTTCDVQIVPDGQAACHRLTRGLERHAPVSAVVLRAGEPPHGLRDTVDALLAVDPGVNVVVCEPREGAPPISPANNRVHQVVVSEISQACPEGLSLALTRALLGRAIEEVRAAEGADPESFAGRLEVVGAHLRVVRERLTPLESGRCVAQTSPAQSAERDSVTQLPTRRVLHSRIREELDRVTEASDPPFSVLLVNLDRFKAINHRIGHRRGDELLFEVGQRLQQTVRGRDVVSRLAGDEFMLMLTEIGDVDGIHRVARRCQQAAVTPFIVSGCPIQASASIGAVVVRSNLQTVDDILRAAALALEKAKTRGGTRIELFDPDVHGGEMSRLDIEAALLNALKRDELFLAYQPIVRLDDGSISGFEALVRWRHPTRGLLQPDNFISVAESSGLIVPVGAWILRKACADLHEIRARNITPSVFMTINISRRQFAAPSFAADFERIMTDTQVEPSWVSAEVTETLALEDFDIVNANLEALRRLGVRISIDDFGIGYSSLSTLSRLPVDSLKIDRSFTAAMLGGNKGDAIVRTIIEMGHLLHVPVIAEGVEEVAQMERLMALECDYGQGYLFSRPVELPRARTLLRASVQPSTPESKPAPTCGCQRASPATAIQSVRRAWWAKTSTQGEP